MFRKVCVPWKKSRRETFLVALRERLLNVALNKLLELKAVFKAMFKVRLDGDLSNLMQWKMSLLMAGSWTRWSLKVPSNPNRSVIQGWYSKCLVFAVKGKLIL